MTLAEAIAARQACDDVYSWLQDSRIDHVEVGENAPIPLQHGASYDLVEAAVAEAVAEAEVVAEAVAELHAWSAAIFLKARVYRTPYQGPVAPAHDTYIGSYIAFGEIISWRLIASSAFVTAYASTDTDSALREASSIFDVLKLQVGEQLQPRF